MGIPILIMGQSGSGKSTSIRNFPPEAVSILNVAKKPLPFRNKGYKVYNCDQYADTVMPNGKVMPGILSAVAMSKAPSIVIDDGQYLLANEFMRRSGENGYQKFTDIGLNCWNLVQLIINGTPPDRLVYLLWHTEVDQSGREKAKTIGKMLDEKITLEGMFSIVLKSERVNDRYIFHTQTNGTDTVKSPIGLFESEEIDNDLFAVDNAIRDYWDLPRVLPTQPEKDNKDKGE